MSNKDMAMVETLPLAHNDHRSTFSRYSPMVRRGTDLMNSSGSPTATSLPGPRHSDPAPFTLESLAAELTFLSTSPTGGFSYLSGDLYNANNHSRGPLLKSRSFPNARRDDAVHITSPPPLRKSKSVRFADSQGLPLVEAVHQLTRQDSSYTANKIVPYPDDLAAGVHLVTGGRRINTTEDNKLKATCTGNNAPTNLKNLTPLTVDTTRPATLRQCQSSPILKRQNSPQSPVPSTPTHRRRFGFTQPSLEPAFFQRVNKECVVLDNIREEPRSLQGTIRVSNLDFEKELIIRWTHDSWRTSHDTRAVFCANDGATDRFSFELPINGDDVVFCIRYRTLGQEYWDNNRGQNYTVFSE